MLAPLVADFAFFFFFFFFFFVMRETFIVSLSDNNQADVIEAFNST